MEQTLEELEEELDELYADLAAYEKQYNDKTIKPESKSFIWSDIVTTKQQINKIEDKINELKMHKTR